MEVHLDKVTAGMVKAVMKRIDKAMQRSTWGDKYLLEHIKYNTSTKGHQDKQGKGVKLKPISGSYGSVQNQIRNT